MTTGSEIDDEVVEADAPPTLDLPPTASLGKLIDQRAQLNREIKRQADVLAALKAREDEYDKLILALLDESGQRMAGGSLATMSVKETVVPVVKDWDALYAFIKENDYFHLLNRAPNAASFRELFERGDPVPGTESFTKRSLTFKSL